LLLNGRLLLTLQRGTSQPAQENVAVAPLEALLRRINAAAVRTRNRAAARELIALLAIERTA
jgi:hypothetical protein